MHQHDDIHYHQKRAAAELNLGLAASAVPVARAHLRLSSLHFEKARELAGQLQASDRPIFHLS
jgi:hypothetical protein